MDYVKYDDKRCVGRKKEEIFIHKINVINAGLYYYKGWLVVDGLLKIEWSEMT